MIKYNDQKMTAKQWAAKYAYLNLELAFDYASERNDMEWDAMTEKEQNEVCRHLKELEYRCSELLRKAGKL